VDVLGAAQDRKENGGDQEMGAHESQCTVL
jgi:hypothetical protein